MKTSALSAARSRDPALAAAAAAAVPSTDV